MSCAAPAPRVKAGTRFWKSSWPERLASLLAVTGVLLSIFLNFHVHLWQASGSDFKTMYASASCMARGLDAYSFPNIADVFDRNSVAQPHSWYGHAPVYPPFTIALLTPFAALPMAVAVYAWITFSGIVLAFSMASLAHFAGEQLGLPRTWRLLLIALVAASPLLSFALEMGNVSVIVTALCLLALTTRANPWQGAAALALALLLKPHLALWVALALFFMHDTRCRRLALRAFAMAAAAAAVLAAGMALQHTLGTQVAGYLAMLHAEVTGGSMDAQRHDLIAVAAQITSLDSLTGYWSPHLRFFDVALLTAAFVALSAATLRLRDPGPSLRLAIVAAWSALGLLATYHRAHDGMILLALLPGLLAALRNSLYCLRAWAILALALAISLGPSWEWFASMRAFGPWADFLLYRQAPFAVLILTALLFGDVLHAAFVQQPAERYSAERLHPVRV